MESRTDILKEKHLNSSNGSFARIILLCSHKYNKGKSSLKVKRNKKKPLSYGIVRPAIPRNVEKSLQRRLKKKESLPLMETCVISIKTKINEVDLIVIGAPVFYYDIPDYVKDFIQSLPDLKGIPVAAYVTFGGPEGNQHNAACSILENLGTNKRCTCWPGSFL